MHLDGFYQYSKFKKKYLTLNREPFFEIAGKYIGSSDKVLDIGSGEGEFLFYLSKRGIKTENIYLLDANQKTVEQNKNHTPNSIFYLAPERLPFEDASIDAIHLSHLIDNLNSNDLYAFLHEMNRVLKSGGHIIISTPLLWPMFYNDISHTRPYNPYIFYKYFVHVHKSLRFDKVSDGYEIEELVYRYYETPLDEGWSSSLPPLDYLIIILRKILRKLGFKRLQKNGYTLSLKKK
ncbi:MAG: class I SAM-dependent methyltransferase [Bacteroidetes bacterium]|nr:class I SAM-dependent methyltransferase [Bacteroidota bacterium]